MMRTLESYNRDRPEDEKVLLCVGLGFGRMLRIGDHEVFGSEVNAASKLGEATAGPNEILVTGAAQAELGAITGVRYELIDDKIPGSDVNYRCLYL